MARTDVLNGIVTYRGKPTASTQDGNTAGVYMRGGRYGEAYSLSLVPTKHLLADEGSYFTAQNPAIGTGVALNAQIQAFSDTNALFVLKNNAPLGSGLRIYLDYLRLILTATTTSAVSIDFLVKLDYISRVPTTAASGTAMTPVNVNGDDATGSAMSALAFNNSGAMTIAAASPSARVAARAHLATGIGLVGDEYILQFGASERSSSAALTAAKAVAPGRYVADAAPVIFGPQQYAVIHRWSLTEAGPPSYEFELGWWER
jgi:hypothetical protein